MTSKPFRLVGERDLASPKGHSLQKLRAKRLIKHSHSKQNLATFLRLFLYYNTVYITYVYKCGKNESGFWARSRQEVADQVLLLDASGGQGKIRFQCKVNRLRMRKILLMFSRAKVLMLDYHILDFKIKWLVQDHQFSTKQSRACMPFSVLQVRLAAENPDSSCLTYHHLSYVLVVINATLQRTVSSTHTSGLGAVCFSLFLTMHTIAAYQQWKLKYVYEMRCREKKSSSHLHKPCQGKNEPQFLRFQSARN